MTAFGRIAQLWRYPVSSLGGERLQAATLGESGIEGDRQWGLVALDDGEVAQPERRKRWRPTAELKSRIDGAGIAVSRDGAAWLPVGSAEAAGLAADHLGFEVTFRPHVPHGETRDGHSTPRYRRDPLHLLTTASLRRLATLLPGAQVDPRRFRPNLLIETEAGFEGFAEAELVGRTLAVGAARIAISAPCKRCAFTTLAQDDLPLDPAVLQAIARDGGGNFGALCAVTVPAPLAVGDRVTLLDRD